MSIETVFSCLAAGGIGLLVGFFAGQRVGEKRAQDAFEEERRDLEMRLAAARSAEPPPPRLEKMPRRDAPAAAAAQRPAASPPPPPSASASPHLPIVDQRPNEDRTVFRKLRSAVDAFRQSQDRLDSLDDRTVVKAVRGARKDTEGSAAKPEPPPAKPGNSGDKPR